MREKWPQGARPCPRCDGTLWEPAGEEMFNGIKYPVVDKCGLCLSRGYVMSGLPERIVPRHQVGGIVQKMLRALSGDVSEPVAAATTESDF